MSGRAAVCSNMQGVLRSFDNLGFGYTNGDGDRASSNVNPC